MIRSVWHRHIVSGERFLCELIQLWGDWEPLDLPLISLPITLWKFKTNRGCLSHSFVSVLLLLQSDLWSLYSMLHSFLASGRLGGAGGRTYCWSGEGWVFICLEFQCNCTYGGGEKSLDHTSCVSDSLAAYRLKIPPPKYHALHYTTIYIIILYLTLNTHVLRYNGQSINAV